MSPTCQYPRFAPTKENPAGDCRAPRGRYALPLGDTGGHLALCDADAVRYLPSRLVLAESVEEDR